MRKKTFVDELEAGADALAGAFETAFGDTDGFASALLYFTCTVTNCPAARFANCHEEYLNPSGSVRKVCAGGVIEKFVD